MAKFNAPVKARPVTSPVRSTSPAPTAEGGHGYVRDPRSELFMLAVANMVGETTFYEAPDVRDGRFRDLIAQVLADDPKGAAWLQGFIPYLRGTMNMRTASVVAAVEYALANGPDARRVIATTLQRADEPGEVLAYLKARTGSLTMRAGVKRGLADAVTRLYTERAALKYGGVGGRDFTMADVVELVHPKPTGHVTQSALFRWMIDRRHGRAADVATEDALLRAVAARRRLEEIPVAQRADFLASQRGRDALAAAYATWEYVGGWLSGPWTAAAWEAVIPQMGVMALIRNLRNFDQAGVSDKVAQVVMDKITNAEDIRASRVFPFRFLAAYRHAPSVRWSYPLEKALQLSLDNVPALDGNTLVLVDRSGSMWDRLSARSELNRADAAAVFGTALAMRAEQATLVQFGTGSSEIRLGKGESLIKAIERFGSLGGTNTATAVRRHFAGHTRVVIVTDEQAHDGDVSSTIPADVPLYTWNLAGYRVGHGQSGVPHRHTFGGLADAAFRLIPILEARRSGAVGWPWEE